MPTGQTRLILFTVTAYVVGSPSEDGDAGQRTFSLLENGEKVSSAYTSFVNGGDMQSSSTPYISKTTTLSAGIYAFTVSYKSWSDKVTVNHIPTNYDGYDNDTESMKTRIIAVVLPVP